MQCWVDLSPLEGPALAPSWEDSCPALLGLCLALGQDSYPALADLALLGPVLAPGQDSCPAQVDPVFLGLALAPGQEDSCPAQVDPVFLWLAVLAHSS